MGKAGELITNLKNHLLVATAELNGSSFERAVIYIANQGEDGAMGFIVNHPMKKVAFEDIARSMGIEEMLAATRTTPIIFRGGPVENTRGFVLHSGEYHLKNTIDLGPGIALSAQADIVGDIARGAGPRNLNFCLGYAGWSAGQLEDELHTNSWLVVPADADLLFNVPADRRYEAATRKLGLNMLNFSADITGLA